MPSRRSFEATSDAQWPTVLVPMSEVIEPVRAEGVQGLHENRARSLLAAMLEGEPLPPVHATLEVQHSATPRYVVRDGFHRYHLSRQIGFTHLPIQQRPYLDLSTL
jgi:hypothetical protein